MGYRPGLDMGLNEFALERAVKELSERDNEPFNYRDIARYVGCSPRTVERGMRRLLRAGRVTATGSRRAGFRYEIVGEVVAYA